MRERQKYYQQTKTSDRLKKVLWQDHTFSLRSPCASEKIKEIWMKMDNTNYNSTEDMNNKYLKEVKGKTKLIFYKNIGKYYDNIILGWIKILLVKMLRVLLKISMKC